MKISNKAYPHPVLGHKDDVEGVFRVSMVRKSGREEITLRLSPELENPTLTNLIKEGKASFVFEIECSATFYRRSWFTGEDQLVITVPSHEVRGRVQVGFFICANEDFEEYRPEGAHLDFGDEKFAVQAGDILATGGYISFDAKKEFDPMSAPVSSFMAVQKGGAQEGPIIADYNSDKILIVLSKNDWRRYQEVKRHSPAVPALHSSLVLPVLVDAIYLILSDDAEFEAKKWYGCLDSIIEKRGLYDLPVLDAAQRILDVPLDRFFGGMEELLEVKEVAD